MENESLYPKSEKEIASCILNSFYGKVPNVLFLSSYVKNLENINSSLTFQLKETINKNSKLIEENKQLKHLIKLYL